MYKDVDKSSSGDAPLVILIKGGSGGGVAARERVRFFTRIPAAVSI